MEYKNKICPIMTTAKPSPQSGMADVNFVYCQGADCAWWILVSEECAIRYISVGEARKVK